MLNIEDKDR
jgi:chromosome segregation ATPase